MSAVVDPSNAPAGKLPLWQTIRLSYATYIQHFAAGLRIAALWLPPIAVLALIAGWLQATLLAELAAGPRPQIDVSQPLHLLMLGHVLNLVIACAAVSSAVAWHRLLLSKEEPPWTSAGNVGTRNLWRYVGAALVICLIAAIPLAAVLAALALFDLLPAAGRTPPDVIAVIALAYVVSVALMLRLSLLLPARATGNPIPKGRVASHTWESLETLFRDRGLHGTACRSDQDHLHRPDRRPGRSGIYLAQWALAGAISLCCWLLVWPIWVGFLSHAYRYLVRTA